MSINMIFIHFIIFFISIDGIKTTNISKNFSSNYLLIIASCQADKTGLEPIPIPSGRYYYLYFHSKSSSSLSFSSSFLPLLHLSYCEHQQTTSYSSNGFSILRSLSRFPLTDVLNKKHSPFFHHHDNVVLSTINQSSSPKSNIITLMSSSNENQIEIDNENDLISTKILSNISLLHTSSSLSPPIQKQNQTFNMILLIGCLISGIILLILIYIIIKYCKRDGGTYKIDESKNFPIKSHMHNNDNSGCTGKISSQKLLTTTQQNLDDSKEWYV